MDIAISHTNEAGALPPIPMRYRDQTASFAKGWYCVAESAEVTEDSLKPVTALDQQLIVYRDADGQAHAADAYCPHLGAHLASHDGGVIGGDLVCPFHKWRFDRATGRCTSIPYSKIIPPQAKLAVYPTRELAGMVLMWWHPEGAAPDFEPFDPESYEHNAPWILTGEKILESRVPFRDLFENLFDTAHIQQLHHANSLMDIEGVTRTDYGLLVNYGPTKEPEQFPITSMRGDFSGISLLSQVIYGTGFTFLQNASVTPIDHERLTLRARMYIADTGSAEMNAMIGGAFVERVIAEIDQDHQVLHYKKHVKKPLLCAGDGPITKYREYAKDFFPAEQA
jgi:3-ketosteroid 9alpha-monooxygenase subunit A